MEKTIAENIAMYEAQEKALIFPSFDREMAWELGCLLRARAAKLGYNFAIGIQVGDLQLFAYVFPERVLQQATWVRRKCATAMHSGKSSIHFTAELNESGKTLEDLGLDREVYGDSGGGFPIHVAEEGVIGAVAVSGLPAEVDHQFVVDSLTEFLAQYK